jgi:hypothetical protein
MPKSTAQLLAWLRFKKIREFSKFSTIATNYPDRAIKPGEFPGARSRALARGISSAGNCPYGAHQDSGAGSRTASPPILTKSGRVAVGSFGGGRSRAESGRGRSRCPTCLRTGWQVGTWMRLDSNHWLRRHLHVVPSFPSWSDANRCTRDRGRDYLKLPESDGHRDVPFFCCRCPHRCQPLQLWLYGSDGASMGHPLDPSGALRVYRGNPSLEA